MAPTMRLTFEAFKGRYLEAITKMQEPIAKAATAAMNEAGDLVKRDVRAAMGAAGFSTRVQNTFRSQVYPKDKKPSINAAVHFFSKWPEPFALFERGGTVVGKPTLWLPLREVPLGVGKKQLTPEQYIARVGPLIKTRGTGGRQYLLGKITRSRVSRATEKSAKLRRPRKGSALKLVNVPLYVGIPSVNIPQKFDARSIIERVRGDIGNLFAKNLKV